MLHLSSSHKFHLYALPTDMRKSFDGLSGLVNNSFGRCPMFGEVFAFINKRNDKLKFLHWQGGGFMLDYKRLGKGTFELPQYDMPEGWVSLGYTHMVMLADGLSIKNVKKRKRYQPNF